MEIGRLSEAVQEANGKRWGRCVPALLLFASIILAVCSVVGWFGRYWVAADVFNHFVHIYGLCGLFIFASAAIRRLWLSAGLAAAVCIVSVMRVAPYFVPQAEAGAAAGPPISIMAANTNYENRAAQLTIDLIRDWGNPDVVVLPECNDRWRRALAPIAADYPHALHTGITAQRYGVSVYSRHRLDAIDTTAWPGLYRRIIAARVDHPGGAFTIVGAHPRSIHSETGLHVHDMRLLAECVAALPRPVVIAGDLNSTPWSPNFARLLRLGDLRDPRRGRGLMPTWPDKPLHVPAILLDAILTSPELRVSRYEVGPGLASDHLPLRAIVHLPAGK